MSHENPTSFPGSLFSREEEKRDPGNEVDENQEHVLRCVT